MRGWHRVVTKVQNYCKIEREYQSKIKLNAIITKKSIDHMNFVLLRKVHCIDCIVLSLFSIIKLNQNAMTSPEMFGQDFLK